jgi:co-chaperonin GroES (HSP10)
LNRPLLEAFLGDRVFGEQSERPVVVISLRGQTGPMARRQHTRSKGEEAILSEGFVGRKRDAVHIAARRGHPEPEPAQGILLIRKERSEKETARVIAMAAGGEVAQSIVRHAVKDADLVSHAPLHNIARELVADVAARHQQSR